MDDTVRKDIGYRGDEMRQERPVMQRKRDVVLRRVRYTTGLLKDTEGNLSAEIAADVVGRGCAVYVDQEREPGEEG